MAQGPQNDSNLAESDTPLQAPSQPMAKASSGGAEAPIIDGSAETSSSSPYGTRSRNRTGNPRPNYAEDRDGELDFDYYPAKKEGDSKKPARQNQSSTATTTTTTPTPTVSEAQRSGTASSRKSAADETKTTTLQNGAKDDSLPSQASQGQAANSSASTQQQPAQPPPSKKRKATSAAQSGNSTPAASTTNLSASVSRRSTSQTQVQNAVVGFSETNLLSFSNCDATPKDGKLVADDGTVLAPNDHVYLVCEPPGEPYYIGRIMEFLHVGNDASKPVDALRINWFYRPKDIGRRSQDTRLLFATMHSDISPLTALRGKCEIRHKSEIKKLEDYRRTPDCFWYEKLYDRYIQKNYDLIPTSAIINVPEKVKRVLDERWKFVLVEQGRGKELTSAMKLCKKCGAYCASHDSVDCSDCKLTYHMNCVSPPVTKKPSRGFGWSCAACSRKHEKKLHARNTPNVHENDLDFDDDDLNEEDEAPPTGQTSTPAPDEDAHTQGTPEQIYQASLWPYRYLGQHCKVEDALDYDDRIYPRASSRLGPRHQATVLPWPGQPVQYERYIEFKKPGKKEAKLSKEIQAQIEKQKIRRETRPKWIQDEPPGYTVRGEDHDENDPSCTATLLWKPPSQETLPDETLKKYMKDGLGMASQLGVPENSTNLQHISLITLYRNAFDTTKALDELAKTEVETFKEPNFTPAEQKKFEDAVKLYGSELHSISKHLKTRKHGDIVRHYYIWKKTERGKQIWGDYSGRKGRKEAKKAEEEASKLQEDLADDRDDSAFDGGKAAQRKKNFICKFCSTKASRQWRRAPAAGTEVAVKGSAKDKKEQYVVALCRRCAELWRRYGIQWEDMDEASKKMAQAGGRAWKRKQDEEYLKELIPAKDLPSLSPPVSESNASHSQGGAVTNAVGNGEPPRKKLKGTPDERNGQEPSLQSSKKKEKTVEKPVEKAPPPSPVVVIPEPKALPCAICNQLNPHGDQYLSCRECRLAVHRNCYGVVDSRQFTKSGKWTCDTCTNDRNPQVSINYKCVLCPIEHTEHDFVGIPKSNSHKKKTDKEREREKQEKEQAQKTAEYYQKKQEDANLPVNPREPLKRTADNNWVHVTCAVWTPEVKFGLGEALVPAEGIASIPRSRFEEVCAVCNQTGGACVSCHHCRTPVHVECAKQNGYLLGFDITPIKGSRRDQFHIVTINGESGAMSAAVWCKDHVPTKTIVHRMYEIVDEHGLNALQLYAQNFKQADQSVTDTVRKANMIAATATKVSPGAGLRRGSTVAPILNGTIINRHAQHADSSPEAQNAGSKVCITCGIDVSPKWWPVEDDAESDQVNGCQDGLGSEALKFIEQRRFQCHKCRKTNRRPKRLRELVPAPSPSPPMPPQPEVVHPHHAHVTMAEHRQPSPAVQISGAPYSITSPPPPMSTAETHRYPWASTSAPVQQSSIAVAPVMTTPLAQPPTHAPHHQSQPPPHISHLAGPPSMPPMRQYPPPTPYNDWQARSSVQHGSPGHPRNGEPPLHPSPRTGLSALRPPPAAAPQPPPPQAMSSGHQGGHLGQPILNGLPPSPLRSGGAPPPPPSNPYMHPYHQHSAMSHGMPNGTPPPPPAANPLPPRGPDHLPQGLMPQRPLFGGSHVSPPPHASPPLSRDGTLVRDSPPVHSGPPLPRPPENRPPSGASASPSLANLLS